MDFIEPLEPTLWFDAIRKLAYRLDRTGVDELESQLRHAYHLLQLTPRPLRSMIRSDLNETKFEQLLESRAFGIAAEALVGSPMAYTVSRLKEDLFEAQVSLPVQSVPTTVQSYDRVATLLSAWALCLVTLEERSFTLQTEYLHPLPRKVRSGRHPRQIVH